MRVAWYPSGTEEVVTEKKVHLADRSLMPGDVVRRLVQVGGEAGYSLVLY